VLLRKPGGTPEPIDTWNVTVPELPAGSDEISAFTVRVPPL